jgi:predicted transcriptional regulator
MFEDTLELAENKLLLLYIINKIKLPVTNTQITQIILENNLINYFTLQQYISELISSSFLKYTDVGGSNRLRITERGIKVLELFRERISDSKCEVVDNYIQEHLEKIKKEVSVTADYTIGEKDNFIVNLKAMENDTVLIDIKLNVASNKHARELCARWKSDCSELYSSILNILTDKIS